MKVIKHQYIHIYIYIYKTSIPCCFTILIYDFGNNFTSVMYVFCAFCKSSSSPKLLDSINQLFFCLGFDLLSDGTL